MFWCFGLEKSGTVLEDEATVPGKTSASVNKLKTSLKSKQTTPSLFPWREKAMSLEKPNQTSLISVFLNTGGEKFYCFSSFFFSLWAQLKAKGPIFGHKAGNGGYNNIAPGHRATEKIRCQIFQIKIFIEKAGYILYFTSCAEFLCNHPHASPVVLTSHETR